MTKGKVFLVGAGPGDPGLVTFRAHELIASADVLVYDYLVHPALLDWCSPMCEKVYVGKKAGFHAVPQADIEKLLVDRAKRGERVVRLKGGDPFIFGRGGEEARQLAADGVDFEVVPGVSASLAAGAFGGIPLTHRNVSSTLVLVTGHEDPSKTAVTVDWRGLARKNTTLCIYMGMGRLAFIASELIAGGMASDTPAACVQWASLGKQRTCVATLDTIAEKVAADGLTAPAIVIVGDVVNFREEINWFERKPLFGRRIVVTRQPDKVGHLSELLEELGAEVVALPMIEVRQAIDPETAEDVFEELGSYDWIVFTSANGVAHYFDAFLRRFGDLRALGLVRIAAVGPSTAKAVEAYHLKVEVVPEKAVAEELAQSLIDTGSLDSAKVLVITGNLNRDVLITKLEEARAIVDRFPVYETVRADLREEPAAKDFREHGADAILFTSSSGVKSFVAQARSLQTGEGARRPLAGSIGPITSETMKQSGMPVDFEAPESNLDSLVSALVKRLHES